MTSRMTLTDNLEVIPDPKHVAIRTGDGREHEDVRCIQVIVRDGAFDPKSVLTFWLNLDAIPGYDLENTYIQGLSWNGSPLRVGRVFRIPEKGIAKIVTLRSYGHEHY